MARISKDPEIRKQEILDAAMTVFVRKGYEETSMADIARELNVVQGLCYRYFKSKQVLYQVAMEQYVKESCEEFIETIHDKSMSIQERLDKIGWLMLSKDERSRYHEFYHKHENEEMHEQLTLKMCNYLLPHIRQELHELNHKGEIDLEETDMIAEFIVYGQIKNLSGSNTENLDQRMGQMRKILSTLLGIKKV